MKKKGFFIIFFISIFILQGCVDINLDIGESIVAPKNKQIPIKGTWKIESYYKIEDYSSKEEIKSLIGKTAIFSEDLVVLGEEVCEKPEYKIKNVNTKDFFLYAYKVNYKDLGFENKTIEVITITSKEKYFYDFIRVNENKLIVCIDDVFYYLSKISDVANDEMLCKNTKIQLEPKNEMFLESNLLRSGVLIGLSSKNNDRKNEFYRTLWIAAKNRKVYSILETPNLFVPRKSGFWIVGENRVKKDGYIHDYLFAYPLEQNGKEKEKIQKEYFKENIIRRILFVGNDYVATEFSKLDGIQRNRLQVLLIDNIKKNIGIKISDIAGDTGRDAYISSAEGYLTTLKKDEGSKLYKPREDSFTLARRNGHWIMKGRLYYKESVSEDSFLEFNINMIPPYKIVHYDELYLSWNQIKEKVPKAIDGYTSPNKDLAIIVTKNTIYVYGLSNDKLSDKYIEKIDLKEGESVVMAEWATGSYVEKWNNVFEDYASNI
ncbi:hypothetical protein FQB35_05605 [Crassaminicella thermophila]|uniref:Lipoprotein n=1 Tax=Crassaminicella thermophila TaxID=2599308 RepID=A0A5C0SDN8_CRATE|nr:hypothetical protein [Crassaminicella thermophila]QEK11886.1 hypothetical protein FQB35_05605 [Crassaminicella thermophila]